MPFGVVRVGPQPPQYGGSMGMGSGGSTGITTGGSLTGGIGWTGLTGYTGSTGSIVTGGILLEGPLGSVWPGWPDE